MDKYIKDLTTIIQISTETDFAAKIEVFLNFMDKIGKYSVEFKNENYTLEDFKESVFDGTSINDQFKDIISKIGENIILNKIQIIQNKDNDLISEYIHNNYRKNIGKIAVVLKTKVNKIDEEVKQLGKNLCMHIAAMKPESLDITDLDKNIISKERCTLNEWTHIFHYKCIKNWLSKKRRYQFSEKNILHVFINELSYLHIEDQYKIFINRIP